MPDAIDDIRLAHKLALGISPLDAVRGGRLLWPVHASVEGTPPGPPVSRHDSGLYALLEHPALGDSVTLRLYEHRRFYVPRRLHVTLPQPNTPAARRPWCSPLLFPGASYAITEHVTGLRGRVLRDGAPMAWARILAMLPDSDIVVGRAHGDDRGEFFLLLAPTAAPFGELDDIRLPIDVVVYGPAEPPRPEPANLPALDPLWDLPIEEIRIDTDMDPVATGEALPPDYAPLASQRVTFRAGRIISEQSFETQ